MEASIQSFVNSNSCKKKLGGKIDRDFEDRKGVCYFVPACFFPAINKINLGTCSTYHNNTSRLLFGAHAHYRCHANGGTLEIDSTNGRQETMLKIMNRGKTVI